ncbi:hypothetical protein FRACYDRAFT_270530 [Fragilariopsis cylindrus CCMP1102]|uniref:Uncharacterized protein n=1 Tax=Fragilariopsis cylindrus CCMP1102 TaxID=635003 RepID=A0A1E7F1P6_9STRA|nr:hypothetical protein FRACYDRAFT_270530 [Fragilariopsis cylindrus CCMP1102]|eukprot:OEU12118.1 hypothetical protein FRACYDRAFT_270530 [Fragilariopsis cylindrus CCMP1102]
MIVTTSSTTTTASTMSEEVSTISAKLMLGTFSWTDLGIMIHEDDADCSTSPSPIVIHEDDAYCSMSPSSSSPYSKRRHVDIINSTNGNNEIRRRRPKYQSQTVIHRPTIQPEVANFSWTDLAIIMEE